MSVATSFALLVCIGLVTYSARAVPILVLADRRLPTWAERSLKHVGPAVLSALVVSLLAGGDGVTGIEGPEIVAVAIAVVVAARTRKPLWSLAAGMVALWAALALF